MRSAETIGAAIDENENMTRFEVSENLIRPTGLVDGCGRRVDHLRLSVTDECDLRCIYCRPHQDESQGEPSGILTDKQRIDFIQFLNERYGLSHLRITGGDPLLYENIVELVASLRRALPNLSMAMTTSGKWLDRLAFDLKKAGLNRLNVSVDSLDSDRYARITGGSLDRVMAGLEAARRAGFQPPKINSVILRGVNDGEIVELARWAFSNECEIRFLEAMPIGPAAKTNKAGFFPASEIRAKLAEAFELTEIQRSNGETAQRYRANGRHLSGTLGVIAPITESFCGDCRRMRLTADGRMFSCLLDSRSVALSSAWTKGQFRAAHAARLVESSVAGKKPEGPKEQATSMVTLGG